MKHILPTIALSLVATMAVAQAPTDLPKTFPELAAILPERAHTHPKPADFGPFSDAVDKALTQHPESAAAAMPALSRDLQDPYQEAKTWTLAILQVLAMRPDGADLLAPLSSQIADAIATGDQSTQGLALMTVANLRAKAPDVVIMPIENLLRSHQAPDKVIVGAADALIAIRPTDEAVQKLIVSVINDPSTPLSLRYQILYGTADFGTGSLVIDNVVQIANTSEDKKLRDTAISAALRIGPLAVARIQDRAGRIYNDPRESQASHQLAERALGLQSVH
jgi:hypothetical protein